MPWRATPSFAASSLYVLELRSVRTSLILVSLQAIASQSAEPLIEKIGNGWYYTGACSAEVDCGERLIEDHRLRVLAAGGGERPLDC